MRQESFLNYRAYVWAWIAAILVAILSYLYINSAPVGSRHGGTSYGYIVGIIATSIILLLTWFGIRKRSYYAYHATLKAWLSSHVWLGLSLLAIVPLHAGFRFGFNVHSLAFFLMTLTILSGMWGAINYRLVPQETLSNRGGGSLMSQFNALQSISHEINGKKSACSQHVQTLIENFDIIFKPHTFKAIFGFRTASLNEKAAAQKLTALSDEEKVVALPLLALIGKKRELARKIESEIAAIAKLRVWLYFHIPLTFGLLVALAAHIISVLYFR